MKKIVIFGAGRSSTSLIDYLLSIANDQDLNIVVLDFDEGLAKSKIKNHPKASAFYIDATNRLERLKFIHDANLVISMLPAHMHFEVVERCYQ